MSDEEKNNGADVAAKASNGEQAIHQAAVSQSLETDKCQQHMLSHVINGIHSNNQNNFNTTPTNIYNYNSRKTMVGVKIEDIEDEIKVEVKDEPLEHMDEHRDLNLNRLAYRRSLDQLQALQTVENPEKSEQSSHTSGKRYTCYQCNECFTETKVLREHQEIHTGKKSYQFTDKTDLIKHQRTHTGEKPV